MSEKNEWFTNEAMDAYNFYTEVLRQNFITMLPVNPNCSVPFDELTDEGDAIYRVRVRILETILKETPNLPRQFV